MRTASTFLIGLALMTALPTLSLAQQDAPSQAAASSRIDAERAQDIRYVTLAGVSDLFEIESGKLALERSKDKAVRDLAAALVADHGKLTARLQAAANSLKIALPRALDARHDARLQQLGTAGSGPEFDRAFIAAQIEAHQEALELHAQRSHETDQLALRQVAVGAAAVVQGHLNVLLALQKK